MIGCLLRHRFDNVRLIHVPMTFSSETSEMGKPSVAKIWHLLGVVVAIGRVALGLRIRGVRPILYFPPAGPNLTPVLRDLVILTMTRPLFARTIFHFHAAGLAGFRAKLPLALRPIFDLAYRSPDVTVATARSGLIDGQSQNGRLNLVVHNGVSDLPGGLVRRRPSPPPVVRLLFVGLLVEDKGVLVLLEALGLLKARGVPFEAYLIGKFHDREIEQRAGRLMARVGLDAEVAFPGEVQGEPLLQAYADADIFCFPSFFAAESFGLVCVEAMRASLPVVATDWRGIPEVVDHGRTGLIVPPHLPEPLADALERLIADPGLREAFGRAGRDRFLACFTAERFCLEMGEVFLRALG